MSKIMAATFSTSNLHSDLDPAQPANNSGLDIESPLPFAYGTFGTNTAGGVPSGGENNPTNPFLGANNSNNNNPNPSNNNGPSVLLSPSYSRKSGSAYSCGVPYSFTGSRMNKQLDLIENRFVPISKYLIAYLTFVCCLLFADMAQMIILYNLLPTHHDKKEILIYIIFPFVCFVCLKMNDLNICNEITKLFNNGYQNTPAVLNKKREIIHMLTFIGFPVLWTIYAVCSSDWIQSIRVNSKNETFAEVITYQTMHSILITTWTLIQFVQFNLCIICLLYCIQHNVHHQEPKEKYSSKAFSSLGGGKFSLTMTNSFNCSSGKKNSLHNYVQKIAFLERHIAGLQTQLIKSKHHNITTNSQLTTEYADEMQEKNQEFRALLSERDLLRTDCENKKSLLNMKKQQVKQQALTIKSLQQIREENIQTVNELRKKLSDSRKEFQKMQLLLQIERQNVQNAQQYFENFA
eukprot:205916_1